MKENDYFAKRCICESAKQLGMVLKNNEIVLVFQMSSIHLSDLDKIITNKMVL